MGSFEAEHTPDPLINQEIRARPLPEIAVDIDKHWPGMSGEAIPYVLQLLDGKPEAIQNFLYAARYWQGDDARRLKAELRAVRDAAS
jgi:hypothetical protein